MLKPALALLILWLLWTLWPETLLGWLFSLAGALVGLALLWLLIQGLNSLFPPPWGMRPCRPLGGSPV